MNSMVDYTKNVVKSILPVPLYKFVVLRGFKRWLDKEWRYGRRRDTISRISFLWGRSNGTSARERYHILQQLRMITSRVYCAHSEFEIINYMSAILSLPRSRSGVVVEAGCFKGGGTAKFSLAADMADRELVVFDSFQGIPDNSENIGQHEKNLFGGGTRFKEGMYCGPLEEVTENVTRYGKVKRCRFIKGWFDDTLPNFKEPVCAIYLDVDLASSTRTCLKYLYPLLQPGGVLFSQDGHLPSVIAVFEDEEFWTAEVGCAKPEVAGLGKEKLIKIMKPI